MSKEPTKEVKKNLSTSLVFISHRSTEKEIADIILDFLVGTGIPRDQIFCSSLPGNDVGEKISTEIKMNIRKSAVNISILSSEYYQSAYCLNEAGIFWFQDTTPLIPIAMPEITPENMYGFLNDEYKLRHLHCENDISYLYDTVREALSMEACKSSIVVSETLKLKKRYADNIDTRLFPSMSGIRGNPMEISTSDEGVVLYYILSKKIRKIKKTEISEWVTTQELSGVNVDNAFDLLSSLGAGKCENDTLELDINVFRKYITMCEEMIPKLEEYLKLHRKFSSDIFKALWENDALNDPLKLFVAYIIDENNVTFGSRWMAEAQSEDIKRWESKCVLDDTLSKSYSSCLNFFIENHLVYESSWTSYGNPREYTLHKSIKEHLFSSSCSYSVELEKIKADHYYDIPF
jgi:hypothetical protein